jgi:hypothetical protein
MYAIAWALAKRNISKGDYLDLKRDSHFFVNVSLPFQFAP